MIYSIHLAALTHICRYYINTDKFALLSHCSLSILGEEGLVISLFVIFVIITAILHSGSLFFFSVFFFFLFLVLDTFEMVSEDEDGKLGFKVNYHYMSQVKNANDANSAARARRLAQEAVTLSTSLPLSSSSSVFVRCDEERLDIMKVEEQPFSYFSD